MKKKLGKILVYVGVILAIAGAVAFILSIQAAMTMPECGTWLTAPAYQACREHVRSLVNGQLLAMMFSGIIVAGGFAGVSWGGDVLMNKKE